MSKASGRTTHEIVGQAVERALADAGLEPTDIDGLMYVGHAASSSTPRRSTSTSAPSHDIWESNKGGGMTGAATAPYLRGAGAARRQGARTSSTRSAWRGRPSGPR